MEIDDFDEQFKLGHLLFQERTCRVCGFRKNLIESFYRTRKNRGAVSSSYSYECKECTIERIQKSRNQNKKITTPTWEYPDW